VYRNTTALPRAFLVPRRGATAVRSANAQLQAVLDPRFDGTRHLVFDPRGSSAPLGLGFLQDAWARAQRPAPLAVPAGLRPGQARVLSDDGNSVQVEVNAAAPSFLVLDDAYYPGWQVWIDGRPAPITRADYVLRAVRVPAGRHNLVFVYAPLSYLAGLAVTIATALLAAAGLIWPRQRRRQARAAVPVAVSSESSAAPVSATPAGSLSSW
jgi:hypothetical protein